MDKGGDLWWKYFLIYLLNSSISGNYVNKCFKPPPPTRFLYNTPTPSLQLTNPPLLFKSEITPNNFYCYSLSLISFRVATRLHFVSANVLCVNLAPTLLQGSCVLIISPDRKKVQIIWCLKQQQYISHI